MMASRQILKREALNAGQPAITPDKLSTSLTLNRDTVWITFHNGNLYWCVAGASVRRINAGNEGEIDRGGAWLRRSRFGWSHCSLGGLELLENELSGKLTKSASYQSTICRVEPFDYLLSKFNDEPLPGITAAEKARDHLLTSIETLLALVTWKDLEFIVAAVFEGSGWRQISPPGGAKKTTDIDLMMPLTGERAFVQIKSRTNQAEFDTYHEAIKARPTSRRFFAYHSSKGPITCWDERVILLGPRNLAQRILDAGLFSWLLFQAARKTTNLVFQFYTTAYFMILFYCY